MISEKIITYSFDKQNEFDILYPNRHNEIHKVACKRCPSVINKYHRENSDFIDYEFEDTKILPKESIANDLAFVCAWRQSKLCKGFCDDFGIDEKYLKEIRK